ncbi:MAG: penicillin-binding protein [Rickettsiales bacterium]|jgi:penicillin-binding protein 1A|nr:penicillin-binding protein [Rickettsiales bacterium]
MTDKKNKKSSRKSKSDGIFTRKPPKKQPRHRKGQFSVGMWIVKWSFVGAIWAFCAMAVLFLYYAHDLPDISDLEDKRQPTITLLARTHEDGRDGVVLAKAGDLHGEFVQAPELPRHVIDAILATEDRRFYEHNGIDLWGLVRAAFVNFQAGSVVQGGSTITQQLAKNIFLTPDRTIKRKVQEVLLAFALEKQFSKDQIMTLYLNRVYLGAGNYGIDAASRYYFHKPAKRMSLYEGAMVAGMLKAPSRYSPTSNPKLAHQRAKQVLINMVDAEFIPASALRTKRIKDIQPNPEIKGVLENPYFRDWVMELLPDYVGNMTEDLIVVTTLDPRLQHLAEVAVRSQLAEEGQAANAQQAAMVVLSPEGEILAMVGGKDYRESQFNRAAQSRRQPGSSFKLFVYLAALERGYGPSDIRVDAPIRLKNWAPQNYKNEYLGEVTLRTAFAKSVNTIAITLTREVGVGAVIRMAQRLGVLSPLNNDLSLALGTAGITLLEQTQAYAHLANHGNAVWVYGITEIRNKEGAVLYKRQASIPERVLSQETTANMNQLLMAVVQEGTGRGATMDRDVAGKTGTSQDYHDAWFIGFTSDYVAGVWVGNDDNTSMKRITGGSIPIRIWKRFMVPAHQGKPAQAIPVTPWGVTNEQKGPRKSLWDSIINHLGNNETGAGEVEYEYPQDH